MSNSPGKVAPTEIPVVQKIITACDNNGVDLAGVWLVGGAVRDLFLGKTSQFDIDLAIEKRDANAFANELCAAVQGEIVAQHTFGTSTIFAPLGADSEPIRIDIAACRTETYTEPGALPEVALKDVAITDDLKRRDFTINALALSLSPSNRDSDVSYHLHDPLKGRNDLRDGVVRVLHEESFRDDPTRVFRAARYATRLGFQLNEATRDFAIQAIEQGGMQTISAERVRTELELLLSEPAWRSLTLLDSWGVLRQLEPRLQNAFKPPLLLPQLDTAVGADIELNRTIWPMRLAALAYSLGDDLAGWLRWLSFPATVINPVLEYAHTLTELKARTVDDELPNFLGAPNSELYKIFGELSDNAFALAMLFARDNEKLIERLSLFHQRLQATALTVRGGDAIAAGIPKGPDVGFVLGQIFLRTLDGELNGEVDERAALDAYAAQINTDS